MTHRYLCGLAEPLRARRGRLPKSLASSPRRPARRSVSLRCMGRSERLATFVRPRSRLNVNVRRFQMVRHLLFGVPMALLCAGCLGDPLAERPGGVFAEHTSPNGVYRVTLSGRPQWVPGGMQGRGVHIIRAAATKHGAVLTPPREIHYADSMDDSFNDDYCGTDWAFENVLRFQACHPVPGAPHRTSDVLIIANGTPRQITFLRLHQCRYGADSGIGGRTTRSRANHGTNRRQLASCTRRLGRRPGTANGYP